MKQIFFLYNVLGFKVCWWGCVLGAINGQKFMGPFLVGLYLLVHLYMVPEASRKSEVSLLVVAGVFGTIADSFLLNTNILVYDGMYSSVDFIAPLWITAMWVGFTATLNHAFKNIIKKYLIQMILGAVAGPMAYIAGNNLGAIKFGSMYSESFVIVIIAIVWGGSFPLLCWISNRMRGK